MGERGGSFLFPYTSYLRTEGFGSGGGGGRGERREEYILRSCGKRSHRVWDKYNVSKDTGMHLFVESSKACYARLAKCMNVLWVDLGPDPEGAVPTSSAQCHTISGDTEARHAVFVSSQHTDALALEGIPDIASPVVVASEEKPS